MMNKAEFLRELEKEITGISQLEKERLLNYYNETLEDAIEDGVREEDAIESLGTLKEIIRQIHNEHDVETNNYAVAENMQRNLTARHILLFLTAPFWGTGVLLLITLYLLYITLILVVGTAILADIVLLLGGCLNIIRILIANFASGVVLFGCMLLAIGILPWLYWMWIHGIRHAQKMYHKGIEKGLQCWQKAVA